MDVFLYPLIGAVIGLLAGLFGIGGGIIIVPILMLIFKKHHFPADLIGELSVGTSITIVTITGFNSVYRHYRYQNIDWTLVKYAATSGCLGTLLGLFVGSNIPDQYVQIYLGLFILYYVIQLNFITPKLNQQPLKIPQLRSLILFSTLVGIQSGILGVAGGLLFGIIISRFPLDMHKVIGTTNACWFPLAFIGCLGYLFAGFGVTNRPPYCLGYIYLPACLGLAATSSITAQLGVRLAHSLSETTITRMMSIFLIFISAITLWNALL